MGGRVAGDQVGMGGFEVDELAKEPVVFRVGNLRPVLRVIEVIVMADLTTKIGDSLFGCLMRHGLVTHE